MVSNSSNAQKHFWKAPFMFALQISLRVCAHIKWNIGPNTSLKHSIPTKLDKERNIHKRAPTQRTKRIGLPYLKEVCVCVCVCVCAFILNCSRGKMQL